MLQKSFENPAIEILRTDSNRYGREWNGVRLNDNYYRLYVLSGGEAQVAVNGHEHRLVAGCSYLFPRTQRFDYACPAAMRLLNVCFDLRLPSQLDLLAVMPFHVRIELPDPDAAYAQMERIGRVWTDAAYASQLWVRGALMQLLAPHFDHAETAEGYGRLSHLQRLKPALDLVHGHDGRELQVGQLSRACGMSRSSFARLFKDAFGISAQDYVRRLRIDHGKRLILSAHRPLAAIAEELGYSSQSYFTREFKSLTGETPSQFRARGSNFEL